MFTETSLKKLAKDSGYIKRERKLNAKNLLESFIFSSIDQSMQSLNTLALDIQSEFNIRISKQAIDKKFTPEAESFLKNVISKLLESQLDLKSNSKNEYGSIRELRIKDSTKFNLPPHLQEEFPGTGGCGSPATVSIQYEIDLLHGRITNLNITPANHADQTEGRQDIKEINKGSLYIRDLGYVNLDYMEAISQQGAYFINRLSPKAEVYEYKNGKYILLDLDKWLSLLQGTSKTIDKNVFVGARKFPCRLVMEAVPEIIHEERVRKTNKNNKKKGFSMTQSYYTRMGLNLWITNFKLKDYSPNQIKNAYRLRWQIELIFKGWKSVMKIHKLSTAKASRVKCQLYTRIIIAILHMNVCRNLGGLQIISAYKLQKIISESWQKFRAYIFQNSKMWIKIIRETQYYMIAKEHKKKKPDIRIIISEMNQN